MSFKLTVLKFPAGISLAEMNRSFPSGGVSLGRGSSNGWVLDDPERFLSSKHCELAFVDGQCVLTDTSTNGTFVNHSHEPVGKGNQVVLADGDEFEIGEYAFVVGVGMGDASASASPFADSPFGQSPLAATPALDDFDDLLSGSPAADPFTDKGVHLDDGFSLSPDPETADPLVALDNVGQQENDPFGGSAGFDSMSANPASDPFGFSGAAPAPAPSNASYNDGSSALEQNISWPSASPAGVIPENWDDDFDLMGDMAAPAAETPPIPTPPQPAPSPFVEPAASASAAPTPGEQMPMSHNVPRPGRPSSRPKPPSRPSVAPSVEAPAPVAPAVTPSVPPTQSSVSPSVASNAPQTHFIEALGLDVNSLTADQVADINQVAGHLMREVTEGMMTLLRSRTNIKNEFRMNVTTIQPAENNPLKFSAGVDEALENMFIRKNGGYKDPNEAFREGFEGVAEHQIAIIAGIRFAYQGMMEQFSPEHLEKIFNKGKKGAVLPSMQKARNWSVFCDYYQSLTEDMERSFQHLFGDNFVQAYEDQLRRLKAERKIK